MLKFFRKIRQNLLMENKTGKYFKYAIGEILLVVIGILIALGINNWNEQRKNRILEQNYIQELKIDLQRDSIAIKNLLKRSKTQVKAKYQLSKYLLENTNLDLDDNLSSYPEFAKNEDYNKDSLAIYYGRHWRPRYSFTPTTTTIDEMKSTGKLGIISDQKLRRSLIETYNTYESFINGYQNVYANNQLDIIKMTFDEIPELYSINNDNLVELFQTPRVLVRFRNNLVMKINRGLLKIEEVNQNLLDKLNQYAKKK